MVSRNRPMETPLFLLFLLLSFSSLPAGKPDLESDRAALLSFRAAVGLSVLPWNATATPCSWHGVTCNSNRVTALRLPGVGLIGTIPVGTIGNLTELRTLSLRFNALSSPIPVDIAAVPNLHNIYLQQNQFGGGIPTYLFSLESLFRLNLAGNKFSGGISPAVNNLTGLRTLYLENNNLTGQIPVLDLPNLVQFNVSFNNLTGSIPAKLQSMPSTAFLGTSLCGGPLTACPGEITPSPSPAISPAPGTTGQGSGNGSKSSKLSGGAIAGIAVGSAIGFLIVVILLLVLCRRKGSTSRTRSVEVAVAKPPAAPVASAAVAAEKAEVGGDRKKLVFCRGRDGVFDLEDLLRASAEVLGKGTFGTAYKAVLEMGTVVAVKRLKDVNLTEMEFREKIEAVGAMDHQNLVPLLAYFYSRDEKLVVYDYMPMGSLSALLHGNRGSGRTPLNWEARSNIALGAARGIEYIHSTNPRAIHGNIKSSNILLTKSYDARVSDHGLAQLVGSSSTPNRVAGYRAPEVTDASRISQKADVYSFGVLLLELLTGKAPAQALLNEEGVDLPRWVQSVVREEWTSEVFDLELLRYQNVEEEMVQLLQLAIDCAAQYPNKRPSMSEVVVQIEEIRSSNLGSVEQVQHHHDDGDDSIDGSRPPGVDS